MLPPPFFRILTNEINTFTNPRSDNMTNKENGQQKNLQFINENDLPSQSRNLISNHHFLHEHINNSSSEKVERPFGVTIIIVLMVFGAFSMFLWIVWLQGITTLDDTTRFNFIIGLIILGTVFMSLAVGLWLGMKEFRYLFIILNILLILYSVILFLVENNTFGTVFIIPSSVLLGYMLLPHVARYFESTSPPLPLLSIIKKKNNG